MKRRTFLIQTGAVALLGTAAHAQTEDAPKKLPDEFNARIVRMRGAGPNEIHVVARDHALYWTLPKNRAFRYPVAVGRDGLYEPGVFYVGAKKEWPKWKPTPEMIERDPRAYKRYEDGMPGGPGNPLGARAIYLFTEGGADSMLRIHGTNDLSGLGRSVSNGCVRMANSHVTHLYEQVPMHTRVVLHPA
ncbi:ErfK/YbiS/YcfS/YnhG family protein/Tat domain protein [Rhodovulum sp. P5]|uniref:L,D-transpeptidase n=1 Tax=Rhodovulum sp. P5 TaxID=1564506 RepID=UPI0009C1F12C|nr:L,D-transpeptidase [Rhodovulum sp. P5]ARE39123.1 ErfK/YbiS/YcfS/YnhG family protein/Tat domain protein [Rhodovulum sp. P5]